MRDFYVALILFAVLGLIEWTTLFNFKITVLARLKDLHDRTADHHRGIEAARAVLHKVDQRTAAADARMNAILTSLASLMRRRCGEKSGDQSLPKNPPSEASSSTQP